MNLELEEKEFKFKESEELFCCFIKWMLFFEKYYKKNYSVLWWIYLIIILKSGLFDFDVGVDVLMDILFKYVNYY